METLAEGRRRRVSKRKWPLDDDTGGELADEADESLLPAKRHVSNNDDEYCPPDADGSDSDSSSSDFSVENHKGPKAVCGNEPSAKPAASADESTSKSTCSFWDRAVEGGGPKRRTVPLPCYIPLSNSMPTGEEAPGVAEAYRTRVRALGAPGHSTSAPVRLTIRKRLLEALQVNCSGHRPGEVKADIIAAEIEETLYVASGSILNDGYKQKFRRLEFNIKDPKNDSLRRRLLSAGITPTQLINMKPDELANPTLKEEYKKIAEYKVQEKMADKESPVVSDAWKCGKCGARKCTYTEIQIRRADEPMTTFVQCTVCSNRWRC